MKQFILRDSPGPEGILHLYGQDYHYLVRVRRLRSGDSFRALLPGGGETGVKVLSTVDGILIGECEGSFEKQAPRGPPIVLYQGLPRGSRMDLIVRQAAEGGLAEIVPFESEYSALKVKALSGERLERWERIIREARQQSGSPVATALRPPCGMGELLNHWEEAGKRYPRAAGLLFHQEPVLPAGTLEQPGFHGYLGGNPGFVALVVGPEGGFSPEEVSRFLAAGFKALTMGNTILRTETAALYAAAVTRMLLLESHVWMLK
jgi:16S rRNA (uracil1498-N3)-methyltransferase